MRIKIEITDEQNTHTTSNATKTPTVSVDSDAPLNQASNNYAMSNAMSGGAGPETSVGGASNLAQASSDGLSAGPAEQSGASATLGSASNEYNEGGPAPG
jgi:hypothetical protein